MEKRRNWTNEEIEIASNMVKEGKTNKEIGLHLNRNPKSVRNKMVALGISKVVKNKGYYYNIGDIINGMEIIEQIRKGDKKYKAYIVRSTTFPNKENYTILEGSIRNGARDKHVFKKKPFKPHIYKVGDIVNGLEIKKQIRITKQNEKTIKGYEVQSLTYPNAKVYEVSEYNLKSGKGDAYVNGSRVCEENSLWSIEDIRKYLVDIDEAKSISVGSSSKKVDMICDICKTKKQMIASDVKRYGFSCPLCSTNTSYPERFFQAYLKAKDLQYDYQVKFDNSRRKIDFYIPSLDVYVEVHGIIHYKEQYGSSWTNSHDRTLKSDNIKREWCKRNNKILIEVDCRESTFNYISNSINNISILPDIFENEISKIENIIKRNKNYDTKTIIELYESGLSYHSVAEKMGLGPIIIYNILKKSNVKMRNINDTRKKKVRCIETGVIYESGREASRILGINQGNLGRVCREGRGTVGGFHWEYVEEDN